MRVVRFVEKESRMVGARGRGEGIGELVDTFSVWMIKKKSSGDGWRCWLHTSVNVLHVTELYT